MHVCMYVCMYVFMCTCVRAHTQLRWSVVMIDSIWWCDMCIWWCDMCIWWCDMCIWCSVDMMWHIHTYMIDIYTRTCTHMHTCTYILDIYTRTCTYMHTCMYICTYVYLCIHTHICVYMHVDWMYWISSGLGLVWVLGVHTERTLCCKQFNNIHIRCTYIRVW